MLFRNLGAYVSTKKDSQRHRERFKCVDFEDALARVAERGRANFDPSLLAGVIFTLDEKPRPQRLTPRQVAYRERLGRQDRPADGGRAVAAPGGDRTKEPREAGDKGNPPADPPHGPGAGASANLLDKLPPMPDSLIALEHIRSIVPDIPQNAKLRNLLESKLKKEQEQYRKSALFSDHRAVWCADKETLAFDEGQRAAVFAYGYTYDPLNEKRRDHMCHSGNFYAEHRIRGCLKRWLEGYRKGWNSAHGADGAQENSRGVDPAQPQPLPEMNCWLREALAGHVRGARASAAKYRRSDYVRKNEIRKEVRERYERGDILGANREPIRNRDDAANAFYLDLPEEDKNLWSKRPDTDDMTEEDKHLWSKRPDRDNMRDWRGMTDLRRALTGAKRLRPPGR